MEMVVDDKPRIIGIIGSRSRDSNIDYKKCLEVFERIYETGDWIVSGGCPKGGDRFAEIIARKYGTTIIIHHADWNGQGKSAGFKRNGKIANDADILIAIVSHDRKGGTEDTIAKAVKLNKEIILIE